MHGPRQGCRSGVRSVALLAATLLAFSVQAGSHAEPLAVSTPHVEGLASLETYDFSGNPDWRIINIGNGRDNSRQFVDLTNDPPVLAVRYPEGSAYPSCKPDDGCTPGGITFYASPLSVFPAQEIRLTYQLAFASNFVPVKGGKLPGLFVGSCVDADTCVSGASGGVHNEDSSVRVVFRPREEGSTDMTAEAYVYVPSLDKQSAEFCQAAGQAAGECGNPATTDSKSYGWDLWRGSFNWAEPRGRNTWNNVTVHVGMNTMAADGVTPNRDGFLLLGINDISRNVTNMVWRTSPALGVNSLFFETFFGGSDKSWATPVDTYTYYRNIRMEKLQ